MDGKTLPVGRLWLGIALVSVGAVMFIAAIRTPQRSRDSIMLAGWVAMLGFVFLGAHRHD